MKNLLWRRKTQEASGVETEQTEYLQYTRAVEETLRMLEKHLHESDNQEEIITKTLATACDFYQGDWCGFIEVDMELGIWTPTAWYNKGKNDKTNLLLNEFESSEWLYRYIVAMKENHAIMVEDIEEIKDSYPGEYAIYQRLYVESVIAVPFRPRPVAFLVVRNPKRYVKRSSMLQMLAFVVIASVNEKKLMDSAKMAWTPENIKSDRDIVIHLFKELTIYTSKGVLRESDIKSPKVSRLLVYLLLHQKAVIPPRTIAEEIWPEEYYESDNPGKNLKGLIYRFRQRFSLISDYQLIETTPNGYRINPELHIITDLQSFDKYRDEAQQTGRGPAKIAILEKGIDIYKGMILPIAAQEHWLMNTVIHYHLRYIGMVNELLQYLAEAKDYQKIYQYASQALMIERGNMRAYYWLIYALYRQGTTGMAKTELRLAKQNLTEEDYQMLVSKLAKFRGLIEKNPKSIR